MGQGLSIIQGGRTLTLMVSMSNHGGALRQAQSERKYVPRKDNRKAPADGVNHFRSLD